MSVKIISITSLLVIYSLMPICADDALSAFDEYIALYHRISEVPPGDVGEQMRKISEAKRKVLSYGENGADLLLSKIDPSSQPGKTGDIIYFLMETGIGREKALPVIRELTDKQDSHDLYPSILSACIKYLGNQGTEKDIARIEKFRNHDNPGIVIAVNAQVARLKGAELERAKEEVTVSSRGGLGRPVEEGVEKTPELKIVPEKPKTKVKPSPEVAAKESEIESASKWPLVVGAIALLVIVAVLLRAAKRKP